MGGRAPGRDAQRLRPRAAVTPLGGRGGGLAAQPRSQSAAARAARDREQPQPDREAPEHLRRAARRGRAAGRARRSQEGHGADARAVMPRLQTGKGVSGAVRYVMGEGRDPRTGELKELAPGAQSRVAWVGGVNLGFAIESREDAELARRVMEFDAANQSSPTRKCEKDCVHLMLGWRPGERPSREEMEEAARGALKALGMEKAKALFVAHDDEDYSHLHIVASKINPETDRAY